jgi:replicative DNA helicase
LASKDRSSKPNASDYGLDLTPPAMLPAERCLLASILVDPAECTGQGMEEIHEDLFTSNFHATVWRAIQQELKNGHQVSPSVIGSLVAQRNPEYALDVMKLAEETVPSGANFGTYLSQARDAHQKRLLQRACLRALDTLSNKALLAEEARRAIEEALRQIDCLSTTVEPKAMEQVIDEAMAEAAPAEVRERETYVPTGIDSLDQLFAGGLYHGTLNVLAARPSAGKSTLAMNIVHNVAMQGIPSVIFSLEVGNTDIVKNLLSKVSGVNSYHIRRGDYDQAAFQGIKGAAERLRTLPIYLCDAQILSSARLFSAARKVKYRHNVQLIVIDYLQLMEGDPDANSREEKVAKLSRSCKQLAKELHIPVLLLSQLNRDVDSRMRKDHRPRLSDLRESGAIEQDADTVTFIHRPAMYDKEKDPERAEIIVAKQRNGPTGTVPLRFVLDCCEFKEWDLIEAPAREEEAADVSAGA